MYPIHTTIKRYLLVHLILCLLVSLSGPLQAAASAAQSDAQESYDYTLQHHADQVSPIEEEAYLDIEEMPRELTIIMQAVASKDHHDVPQLLAMVAEDVQNKQYYKYLFASNGLLAGSLAQQKAHNLNYHLVKAPEGPVIWQVLSFLDQKPYLAVKELLIPYSAQLCLPCGHMCIHLFGKKLPVHKTGCQGQPFPTTAAPISAIACFYSNRFKDQQRRLVMSQIEDGIFPAPKKRIMPPPTHNPHEPTSQPIQPVPSRNQLHIAVQLHFPIDTIKFILTNPQTDINALDSSGKTPLDYATQESGLYPLLIRHNAKTSQQLTQNEAPVYAPSTSDSPSHHSEENQAAAFLPKDQLLIPANGQCLYTTIIMGYLLPIREDSAKVIERMDQLFGMQLADCINPLYQTLENPTYYLTYLRSDRFSRLVTDFMVRMQIIKGTWGGPAEIQIIANKLKVNIQEYYPDPSNPTTLLLSDLTKPADASKVITIDIVRDKVHPAEVLTQTQKASAQDNPHYQHYRLKYTLLSCSSAQAIGAVPSHSSNSIPHKPVITTTNAPTKLISATSPKASNHRKDGHYTISNPLVLLTCAVTYQKKSASLPTVKEEMQTLYDLFKRKCGYEVVSTLFDKAGNIFPRHQENEKEMDGKWLYKSKLITWIDQQVTYLQQHGKKYDALIFIFSGHGGRARDGREYIVTSDGGLYLWQHIESTFASDPALHDDFGHKPKLFLKLACRNSSTSVITENSIPVDKTNLFRCYATAEGKISWTDATKELTNALFDFFQEAIQHGYALSWIENRLKEVMKRHPRQWDAPETGGGLITDKIFFQKKEKGKFSLPATNNLPKLPHEDCHIMSREEEIEVIAYDFLDGQIQQALIAAGGLGKSTLARLYAREYLAEGRYAHAWWFNAEDEATLAASIAAVNKAMGIEANDHLNMRQGMDKIKEKLQTCPEWLLIFDNVQDPSKLLIHFLPKDTTRGHILITSRCDEKKIWSKNGIYPKPVAGITRLAAKKFLPGFHIPEGIEEETALTYLLTSVEEKDKLLPLTLAQIGYYLKQEKKARSQDRRPTNTIYQDYLALYETTKEHYSAHQHSIARSIVITFTITANRIQKKIALQKKIAQGKATELEETWRILRVMSFLHPDGLDWAFFAHLRPSRKGTNILLRSWVEDQGKTIDHTQAYKAATCLCDYGILIGEEGKYRAHRAVQEIMRCRMKKEGITLYIQDQALQLLETMQQQSLKAPTNKSDKVQKQQNLPSSHVADEVKSNKPLPKLKLVEELRFEMAAHCRTLMGHIHTSSTKRTRLLRLMSQIDSQAYLRSQLYISPQATNGKSLHKQVIQFVNGDHPLLLLTADAGSGKSTYGCYLVEALWNIYYTSKLWAHIPLFISLPAYCTKGKRPPEDLITRALRTKGLNDTTISKLQQAAKSGQQPWVFFLDGYDEVYGEDNLFEACNLSHWGTKYSKYIITCRTEYLEVLRQKGKAKENLFTAGKKKATTLSIAPFSPAQVEKYIEDFAESEYNEKGWRHQRYQQALAQSPQLKAWMTTPFLLVIGLQALPILYGKKNDSQKAKQTITKADICEAFIKAWMDRELHKSQARIKDEAYLKTFCEELAYALFIAEKQVMQKHDPQVQKFFTCTIQLQSAPLRHIAEKPGSYQFMHPDFQDYFAASFIFKNIAKNKLPPNLPSFSPNMKAFLLYYRENSFWHYLRPIQQVSAIAASNSFQILYWLGHRDFYKAHLTRLDLSGINLARAKLPQNLSNTNLSETTLPQDLSNTNLNGAKLPKDLSKHRLTHANLSNTDLTNVKLPKDLSYTNLSGATLPKYLSGINLSGKKLPKDLSSTNLRFANISDTNLTNVKLPKDLSNTNLSGATLPKDLSGINLSGAKLPKELSSINLNGANLSHTNLINVKLPKDLSNTNMSGTALPKDLSSIKLNGANLSNTNLTNVKLPKNLSNTNLSGATLPKDLSSINLNGANLSFTNLTNIKLPKDLSRTNLSGATLPKDVSSINLKGANLTYVQLDSATLNSLTCDYQQCFQDQAKANKLSGGTWYLNHLPKDLKSITQVYPRLSQDSQKAELLQIASGLAYLPYWENAEFRIKVYYWSCKLLLLKNQLSSELSGELVCSLAYDLENDAREYCWQTNYPQNQVEEAKEAPHNDFDQYLKTFQAGLQQYNCKSKESYGYHWYKYNIKKNIQGLQETYPKLTSPKLQKEAVDIAFQLSKIYQNQHLLFLFRYLFLQNRLIRLKISAGVGARNEVHYGSQAMMTSRSRPSWSRGKK